MTEIYTTTAIYFIKYLLAYALLFVVLPCFIFTNLKSDFLKNIVINFIKITFWMIVFGYLLVLVKLYEFITFFIIVVLIISFKYYKRNILSGNTESDLAEDMQILVINHVDRVERIGNKFLKYLAKKSDEASNYLSAYFGSLWSTLTFIVLSILFLYIGYLHFFDALNYVAPPANGSYLNIARMKYLGNRVLFQDGIYPQGFYFIHETIQKITQIDHLYINNFTGGLNSLLYAFGLYFFVSKLCDNKGNGILAVIVYGLLGSHFVTSSSLQILGNPQQYANIFILPVLFFFYEYIGKSRSEDFFAALIGISLIGLIYPLTFVILVLGILCICFAFILRDFKNKFGKTIESMAMILMGAIVTLFPLCIGLLFGKEFNENALNILFETAKVIEVPSIRIFDFIALFALVAIFIHGLFKIRDKSFFINRIWIFIFGVAAFMLYRYGGALTHSPIISEGARTLWELLIPVVISFSFLPLFDLGKSLFCYKATGIIFSIVSFIGIVAFLNPIPTILEKQEHNSNVVQYLRISKNYRPTNWMIVSWQEEYPLVLGNGYHMMTDEFISNFSAQTKELTNRFTPYFEPLKTEDIFIFYEKKCYERYPLTDQEYEKRTNMNSKVYDWITTYEKYHDNITLFYHDENIAVWNIHQEADREEQLRKLWGR